MNVFLWNARARNTHVEATLNHPFPAQVTRYAPAPLLAMGLCSALARARAMPVPLLGDVVGAVPVAVHVAVPGAREFRRDVAVLYSQESPLHRTTLGQVLDDGLFK